MNIYSYIIVGFKYGCINKSLILPLSLGLFSKHSLMVSHKDESGTGFKIIGRSKAPSSPNPKSPPLAIAIYGWYSLYTHWYNIMPKDQISDFTVISTSEKMG